jgi:hypothetical protein
MTTIVPWYDDPNYLVYSDGRIYSKYIGKFLTPSIQNGYYRVKIGSKKFFIHRMVAEIFCENPEYFTIVDHIDRKRKNNNYDNLRWVSQHENNKNKNMDTQYKLKILQHCPDGINIEYNSITEAGRYLGIPYQNICACLRGERKSIRTSEKEYSTFTYVNQPEKNVKPVGSKEVPEYPGYFVTDDGKVYSVYRKRFLSLQSLDGYLRVNLRKNGKSRKFLVHRLVCELFTENKPENYQELVVNHIDGIRSNNNISNLEYATAQQNTLHSIYVLKNSNRNGYFSHAVHMYDPEDLTKPIQIFSSMKNAGLYFGCTSAGIIKAIQRNSTYKGYYFRKVTESIHDNVLTRKLSKSKKPIRIYYENNSDTLVKSFSSIRETAEFLNISVHSIYWAMKKDIACAGYIFKRIPDEEIPEYLKTLVSTH